MSYARLRIAPFLLCSLLILEGCTLWGAHTARTIPDATGGESLERGFWNDVKAKRWDEIEKHISATYIAEVPSGRLDRATAMARLRQFQLNDFSIGDVQTEWNSNTVVVSYTLALRGTVAGQPLSAEPQRIMGVWQKQKAGWMAIAHSVTTNRTPQTGAPAATPTPQP